MHHPADPAPAPGDAEHTEAVAAGSSTGRTGQAWPPGRWAATPLAAPLRAAWQLEQLHLVWLHAASAMVLANAFAMLGAWQLRASVPASLLWQWVLLKLVVALLRLLHARQLMPLLQPFPDVPGRPEHGEEPAADGRLPRWRHLTLGGLLIDGAVWGLAGAWLMHDVPEVVALVVASLASVACVATFGLQISLAATACYVLPILLPTAASLLLRGDRLGVFGGLGLLLLVAAQLATAARMQRRLLQAVTLRLQARDLMRERSDALQLALQQSAVKSKFLGAVSHELRTPLHGIMGLARLMHLDSADALARRRIELIESSGRHLLGLISDLLDMAVMEEGRFALREEVFDLCAQLNQVMGVYEVRAQEKGLRLDVDCGLSSPLWVRGDPVRFRQVLHNLLGNAVKFTAQGHVALRVRPAEDDGEGERWLIEVEDSGPGIAEADQARVFEAFEQADAGMRPLEGTGLGLRIARAIAQRMGGGLTLESRLGEGCCFRFVARLPRVAEAASAAQVPADSLAGQRLQVLLAEDDDVNAMIAEAYLQRLGVVVERVPNGREAVRRALRDNGRPDLVLMDCRMPVMDGYEATREIRRREAALGLPRLPIVALTATVTALSRAQCLEAGMDDFLSKPFTLDDLARVLQRPVN